ncbi:sulfurtransferase complex subunit TusD [Buchnera aphidicola (Takecallis taiwana)]|uniref:sulfurtransferase complex subunit TusD n=1 Tax=Buchnera aphidicola TaxID=9 RepID=UPI0031B71D21
MLVYTILVTHSLFDSQNSKSAFLFSKNIMQTTNNSIHSIFFYSDGVFNGINRMNESVNGINLVDCWCKFSKKFSINLYLCSTAARNRGMVFKSDAKNISVVHDNHHAGFQLVGLGKLAYSILHSDRLLQF